jgi:hypothetical protein
LFFFHIPAGARLKRINNKSKSLSQPLQIFLPGLGSGEVGNYPKSGLVL